MDAAANIEKAAAVIREGGLVAFPTETVYGLGANAYDETAVRRVYAAKERPLSSPLIVHVADIAMAKGIVSDWPSLAGTLASRFWPGPLTIILPKAPHVPAAVTAGLSTVAVRVPAHAMTLELIRKAGVPLAGPSANPFTHISPTTAQHVRRSLGDRVDMILDGGRAAVGIESTVVSLANGKSTVLRLGMISLAQLEEATGQPWQYESSPEDPRISPGLHPRHYAPRTPLFLLQADEPRPEGQGVILDLPADPVRFAEQVYAALHAADEAGWDWIAIWEPPPTPEWDAVRDRLKRACTRT